MEDTLGYYAQIITFVVAIFYALMAASGLVNLYLRYNDHLTIDKADVKAMTKHAGFALILTLLAKLFSLLPFFMVLGFLLCAMILYQVFNIVKIGNALEK